MSWINVFLFAMLVVPDWDDAMVSGAQGLHTLCGVLSGYFLLCAISLDLGKPSRVKNLLRICYKSRAPPLWRRRMHELTDGGVARSSGHVRRASQ